MLVIWILCLYIIFNEINLSCYLCGLLIIVTNIFYCAKFCQKEKGEVHMNLKGALSFVSL